MSDQSNIAELERRITTALARIGAGLDRLDSAEPQVVEPATAVAAPEGDDIATLQAEFDGLTSDLAAEKARNAQMAERLRIASRDAGREREPQSQSQLEAKVEKMTQQLDVQGLELQRMRKSTIQLRENLRVLHEAARESMVEPQMINKAMMAELESLRATRHTETAEMDEILAELKPLIEEAHAHG
ncbi:hypothetical protein [Pseudorhodobacter sp.]|uniref:hypothetical protein n=1 Tax=Pseudorhodobacter sp. TaxID=1934400 RepID=UPI002649AECD|nr:hypothetical protein [Pseudorhodobacter sp.]MDN5788309.1 hypothetical protein [Pseudorhodobacter sp.]